MSEPSRADLLKVAARVTDAAGRPGQPGPLYDALSDGVKRLVGHKLFTLMFLDMKRGEAARIYSNRPEEYPVGGRKPLGEMTDWGRHVIGGRQPWLGRTDADIRWAFFDHELIRSLGCGACINLPVLWDGAILGTMNILDAEHAYHPVDVATVTPLAAFLTAPYLAAIAGAG
ncbi:MAG: GAF domain-containing protein [Azospirillaceae bacterium]